MTDKEQLQRIEAVEKELQALKVNYEKSKKFKWKYLGETMFVGISRLSRMYIQRIEDYSVAINHGRFRKTIKAAEQSLLRNKRANRLEALVEQLQGNLEGKHSICKNLVGKWVPSVADNWYPDSVLMREETATTICKMLNNKEFSLEGDDYE